MNIKNGILSHFLTPNAINELNDIFNERHPGIDAEISVNFNEREESGALYFRYVMKYTHALESDVPTHLIVDQDDNVLDVHAGLTEVLAQHKVVQSCDHNFTRRLDPFGTPYPDGRGECTMCGLKLKRILPSIAGRNVIKIGANDQSVVAQHDWGDCFLQGGDSGLVLAGEDSYETAFVEAFPTIGGLSTFIRGEGNTIKAAELACWGRYQRQRACLDHDWSREVHGQQRDDGYAQCTQCGMFARALEPLTRCQVCDKPTTKTYRDGHLCFAHYFDLSEDERLDEHLEVAKRSSFRRFHAERDRFDFLFTSRIELAFFKQLGEPRYLAKRSTIRQLIGFIKHQFYVCVFGHGPFKPHDWHDDDMGKMALCHGKVLGSMSKLCAFLDAPESPENKITLRDVVPSSYWPIK